MSNETISVRRPRSSAVARTFGVSIIAAMAMGCTDMDAAAPEEAVRTFSDPAAHEVHIGLNDAEPDAAIGMVLAGRLSPTGDHVAILDWTEPFVKVFRRDGTLRSAFLHDGGGPDELERPSVLAMAGDSLILVGGNGRLLRFDLDGRFRSSAKFTSVGLLSATATCDGEWAVYGPSATGSGDYVFYHRVSFPGTDSVDVRSSVVDELRMPSGQAYGMIGGPSETILHHTRGPVAQLLRIPCDGGDPEVLWTGEEPSLDIDGDETGISVSIAPGDRFLAGMAAVEEGWVIASGITPERGDPDHVELTLVNGDRTRRVLVPGDYQLLDSRRGVGVLVGTSSPVPQVFVVPDDAVRNLFHGD